MICLASLVHFFQGFTKFYEFSSADIRAGADIINRLFMKSGMFIASLSMQNLRSEENRASFGLDRLNLFANTIGGWGGGGGG